MLARAAAVKAPGMIAEYFGGRRQEECGVLLKENDLHLQSFALSRPPWSLCSVTVRIVQYCINSPSICSSPSFLQQIYRRA
jgi:hypothetical protein